MSHSEPYASNSVCMRRGVGSMRPLLCLVCSLSAVAQTPTFEAGSIKPNQCGPGPSAMRVAAGRVSMQNVSLEKILLNAYGIPDDRKYAAIGPDWLLTEHF